MSPDAQLTLVLAALAAIEAEQQLVRCADVLYQAAEGTDAEAAAQAVLDSATQLRDNLNALGRLIAPQATRAVDEAPIAGGA